MSIFTNLKFLAFDVVTSTMGDPVVWSTAPGGPLTALALFREPTGEAAQFSPHGRATAGADYTPAEPQIEYRAGVFPGLYEAANLPNSAEFITLADGRRFLVGTVKKIHDGGQLRALLSEDTSPQPDPVL